MSVENIAGFNNILNKHDVNNWTKSANIEKNGNPFDGINFGEVHDRPSSRFSDLLAEKISEVNNLQVEANQAIEKLVSGQSNNLHETMLAVEKAEISFKAMNQIRLKVLDAYKEIMRMQV